MSTVIVITVIVHRIAGVCSVSESYNFKKYKSNVIATTSGSMGTVTDATASSPAITPK